MNNKKLKPLFIIIAIIVIIIVLMLLTLFFINKKPEETNNEEPQKIEISNSEKEKIKEQIYEYFTKKQNTPYENTSEFITRITSDTEPLYYMPTIEISGKTDIKNQKAEGNIEIKYADNFKFPIKYKNTKGLYGIQSDVVSKQYIAIKNDKLSYQPILDIINNVREITKTEEEYTLEFDEETSKNLAVEFLETFEQDIDELKDEVIDKYNKNEIKFTISYKELNTRRSSRKL